MRLLPIRVLTSPCLLLGAVLPAHAGTEFRVTVRGEVEFNGISQGPLGAVASGESATMEFLLDEDDFVNSGAFPTRGYVIDPSSWTLAFDSGTLGLQDPLADTRFFVLRDNDPAVDGFFISTNVNVPAGLPLNVAGGFGQFESNYSVTYGGATLPSLDIADAVGEYDFGGLTVFNWTISDGPFEPFGVVFESMSIVEVVPGAVTIYGCGVNPAGSLTLAGGEPTIGKGVRLGIDNPLGTQAAGSASAVIVSLNPSVGFPCGISIPGLGMAGPGADGELLIELGGFNPAFFGDLWTGPGFPAQVTIPIPENQALVGVSVFAQGLLIDAAATQGVMFGLTDAAEIAIGN